MMQAVIPPTKFVGLHCHSTFSTGDGFGMPADHIDFVLKNGMDAWTLTDHGNGNGLAHAFAHTQKVTKKGQKYRQLYGVEFYFVPSLADWRYQYENRHALKTASENIISDTEVEEVAKIVDDDGEEEVGLVLEDEDATKRVDIDTNEWKRRYHLVILAKNQTGLQNLFTLVKKSYRDGFYRYPRIDFDLLKQHREGLVVSTACMGGYLANMALRGEALKRPHAEIQQDLQNGIGRFVDCVGIDNFFLELQFNKLEGQHTVNKHLLEAHDRTGVRLLATADSHYPAPDKWEARELYKKLGRLNTWDKGKDNPELYALPKFEDLKCELYPKNAVQMWQEYLNHRDQYDFYQGRDQLVADAIERTHEVAWDMCDGSWIDTSAKLPNFSREDRSAFGQLADLAKEGLIREGLSGDPAYVARAKRELADIKLKGFENYFLTLHRVMQLSSKRILFGAGRGSAAGSLVCYLMGITDVDPLKYNLLWERFVNIGRCLRASTLVLTQTGPRELSSIVVGDKVMTKFGRWRAVTDVHRRVSPVRLAITVMGETLVCSDNHKWITNSPTTGPAILQAASIVAGHHAIPVIDPASFAAQKFKTVPVTITSIDWLPSEESEELIDLTVAEDESFFVSTTGNYFVLTHNSSFPDIDSDISDRDIIIEDAKTIFGDDNVIPVSNFNLMKLKSLVKDISKFYDVPFDEVNAVTGPLQAEVEPNVRTDADEKSTFVLKHDDCMEYSPRYKAFMDKYPQVENKIRDLFGQIRSVGRHAGGVLICPDLEKYMPVITVRGETQTSWTEGINIRNLEENGFLKFDFLGLATMRMVEDCIQRVLIKQGMRDVRFSDILHFFNENLRCRNNEPGDPAVFKHVFQDGRFVGVFQLQSGGARQLCRQIAPNNIDELAAMTALYRPGPLKNGSHTKYLYSKANPDTMVYKHPAIKEVLEESHGQVIFQEQFINLAQKLAGFSPTDADKLRKTLVKKDITTAGKRGDDLEKAHKQFILGAVANGCPEFEAKRIWEEIERQALYCFNKTLEQNQLLTIVNGNNEHKIVPIKDVVSGDLVLSRDEKTGDKIVIKIVNKHDHGMLPVHEYVFDTGEIVVCTRDHKFRTAKGQMLPINMIMQLNLPVIVNEKTESRVVSEKFIGVRQTYDLEVSHPDHQFFLANGLLTSNSHSVAYAIDSYYSAWLHTHHEKDWLCTVLQSAKDPEELGIYIGEVKQQGYNFSQIDVNHSGIQWEYSEDLEAFVPPLSSLKGLGEAAMEEIIQNRPYRSLEDLLFAPDGSWRHSKFNRTALKALCMVEGFSSLDELKSGVIGNHAQLHRILFEDKNFDILRKGRKRYKPTKKNPEVQDTLPQLIEDTAMTPEWTRSEKITNFVQTCSSVDNSVIYPNGLLERLRASTFKPITSIDPTTKKASAWFLILACQLKKTKNGKFFYSLRVTDDTNRALRMNIWGVNENFDAPKPYDVWVGHVDSNPEWGPSTFMGSIRPAPGM